MAYHYKTCKVNGKTKLLHRHVAEQKLGRPLTADEQVHHENEQRWDNAPTNLEVLPASEHQALHADERLIHPRTKCCDVCLVEFTPHRTKRKRAKTCSKACADKLRSISTKAAKAPLARAIVLANYVDASLMREAA